MPNKYQAGFREIKDLVDKSSVGKPLPKKRKHVPDKTLLNRMDFAGIPPITKEEARACALTLSGTSITISADPVDLETVLRALGIWDFLRESSEEHLAG